MPSTNSLTQIFASVINGASSLLSLCHLYDTFMDRTGVEAPYELTGPEDQLYFVFKFQFISTNCFIRFDPIGLP